MVCDKSLDTFDRFDSCLLDVWVLFQPVWVKMTFSLWIESYVWFCDFDDAFDCVIVGMKRVYLTIFKLMWMASNCWAVFGWSQSGYENSPLKGPKPTICTEGRGTTRINFKPMESSFTDEDIHEHIASWQHLDKTCLCYQALDTVDTSDDIWYGVRAVALVCACCFGKFCEFSLCKSGEFDFLCWQHHHAMLFEDSWI